MDAWDEALAEQSEQGSKVWYDIRAGRFTSSEMYRLMGAGKREMTEEELKKRPKTGPGSKARFIEDPTVLPDGFMTFVNEKVAEVLTGIAKTKVFSYATQWGEEYEPVAAEFFEKLTGLQTEPCSFIPFGDHAGGTSDRRIVGKKQIVEFKCPHNSTNQVEYLMLTDQWDIKRMYPEFYYQMQSNMLFDDQELCHFATFDPRMKLDKHKMVHIEVKPNAEDFDLITKKLALAIKEKLELLKLLNAQGLRWRRRLRM